ncbi:MAG: 2-hydroxyacyl-CoA dehydratase [Lachnospiraceae bacterium]|nr:2-hydroxyacyl-CoA dehydratase [Lachnospiraceae bacterium]
MAIRECALKDPAFQTLKHAYDHRDEAARAFRAAGGKVIGELGWDVPNEFVIGAGMMPLRIWADPGKPTAQTDRYLEYSFDPVVRAQFEQLIDGTAAGLTDALTVSNSTDVLIRAYLYLREIRRTEPECRVPDLEFIDWLFTREMIYQKRNEFVAGLFRNAVDRWAGRTVADDEIRTGAQICNRGRAALRKIAALRRGADVRVNGSEALVIIGSAFFMDRAEHAELVERLAEAAASWPVISAPRIYFTGSAPQDTDLYDLIEAQGLVIVGEDHDWGDRFYERDFDITLDPVKAAVDRYMLREFSSKKAFVSQRVEALDREAADAHAGGVIFFMNEYEESASWDYPSQSESLRAKGIKTACFAKMKWPVDKNEGLGDRLAAFAAEMKERPAASAADTEGGVN